MFTEKNIPKIIILTPIITVILIAFFTIYFFIQKQNSYFEEESLMLEKEYILKKRALLKKEVGDVLNYLKHHVKRNKKLSEKELKIELLKYIETIRFDKYGYIWVHDTNYYLKAHPFRKKSIDTYDINLKDDKGELITKRFVDETIKNPNGVFIEYYWKKPKFLDSSKKLGFFKLYKKYDWVIGSGLYIDDIENSIYENKKLLEKRIDKYIRMVVGISILVIMFIGLISFFISKKIIEVLKDYKDKVEKKELLLSDLNKNLKIKIKNAIKDVQKKDKVMFHQSRLARMGVMLSMIAHQWRQPLSELSGILMELETANKFKKLDDKFINECIEDSNKQILFMSNTIEDFRNFFKPDKQKIDFYVNKACYDAISLVEASMKSLNISLEIDMENDYLIFGYEREFSQVILNLISNAKDVLIQRNIANPKIRISSKIKEKNCIIKVQDNALGIDEQHIDLIFEPYFTTKEPNKGTGLGLYMAKMIIEQNMNGQINVSNTKKGAKFLIMIPINEKQNAKIN